jgi:hypothetical protein
MTLLASFAVLLTVTVHHALHALYVRDSTNDLVTQPQTPILCLFSIKGTEVSLVAFLEVSQFAFANFSDTSKPAPCFFTTSTVALLLPTQRGDTCTWSATTDCPLHATNMNAQIKVF